MSCIKGFCPSFVTVNGGSLRRPASNPAQYDFSDLPEPELPDPGITYGIVIAGVGGTGVTTLGAILGMAAHIEGSGASLLDMTGLAQKFGAVITHLQVATRPEDINASRIAAGGARLVIGCDLVVAAANDSMVKVNRGTAYAVVNAHEAMTAEFTRDPDSQFPAQSMRDVIEECVGRKRSYFVNSSSAVEQLLGGSMAANLFLAGYAYQKGLIPISFEAIVEAIKLNGASVDENICAFKLGRLQCHAPERICLVDEKFSPLRTLDEIVADRSRFLEEYQSARYARAYRQRIEQFATVASAELAEHAAQNYYKLLAYKDEYEVARLYSQDEFREALEHQFEGDYKLQYHLAPPFIAPIDKHTGLPKKLTFGEWMGPVFKLLARFRFLRGSPFDPFALSADRKLERDLISWYEGILAQCERELRSDNHQLVIELLRLPERIRGFGHVKSQSAGLVRVEAEKLLVQLRTRPEPIKLFDPRAA